MELGEDQLAEGLRPCGHQRSGDPRCLSRDWSTHGGQVLVMERAEVFRTQPDNGIWKETLEKSHRIARRKKKTWEWFCHVYSVSV